MLCYQENGRSLSYPQGQTGKPGKRICKLWKTGRENVALGWHSKLTRYCTILRPVLLSLTASRTESLHEDVGICDEAGTLHQIQINFLLTIFVWSIVTASGATRPTSVR